MPGFNNPFGSPFDNFMFNAVPIFVGVIFIIVFGGIIFSIFKGIQQWNYNNQQPILIVPAKIIAKRQDVRRNSHHHAGDSEIHHHHTTTTNYYITFEVESGDRMEFEVNSNEYGLLAEGDFGKLKFQGTRYLEFARVR